MLHRIKVRIQRFWDIMTDKEWEQAILDADKGDSRPFEFTTMIDKSEIKELLQQRITKHNNTTKAIRIGDIQDIWVRWGREQRNAMWTLSLETKTQKQEILWLAEQLNIDLEDDDQ